MRFTKMHGLGNDYVFVNTFQEHVPDPAATARLVSDRHFGIGSDGLILICPSKVADARMRIFNADGSEAQMCGNGIRCVAKYIFEHGMAYSRGPFGLPGQGPRFNASVAVETGRGVLTVGLDVDERGKVRQVCVNMGRPIFEPEAIPVKAKASRPRGPIEIPLQVHGLSLTAHCLSMGNPHAVLFVDDLSTIDLAEVGPVIEQMDVFPQRINVHVVQVVDRQQLRIATWERGSGITLACGTGASACCVAAACTGRACRAVTAILPGGELSLVWHHVDDCVYMTGPAVEVFEGRWLL